MSAVQDDDIEDYDYLKLDPDTLIHGSRGGAGTTTSDDSRPSQDSISTSSRRISFDSRMSDTSSTINIHESARIRRQSEPDSIPPKLNNENIIRRTPFLGNNAIRLESTEEEGRYILTADDDEVREILRLGAEREKIEQNPSRHRSRIRDLVFTRQFTTFDRQNPLSSESPFHGFFTLFWLAMVLIFVKVSANNWRQYGSILGSNEVVHYMFARDIVVLGVTDLAMLISTASGLLLQKVILKGYLTWARSGWIIQNIWQTIFLASLIGWTFYREWPWTHTIFMVLHALVYLMKQHSYAFYNGHLSTMYRRRTMLKRKLAQLRAKGSSNVVVNGTSSAIMSPQSELMDSLTSPALRPRAVDGARIPSELTQGDTSDIKRVTKAIEDGKPFTRDQVDAFERLIESQIKALDQELQGKCEAVKNSYPNNLTWRNFVDWTCLPTLVYELEYPRLDYINWWYVAEKTAATFGVLAVMMVVSQAFIYPSVAKTVRMKEASVSLEQRWVELPWLISDILFPLLLEQLLSWYVIWECVLNVLAEVTRFADRGFYGDWWNSVSWDQYARDWNRPVHNFLLRHVYHSSISTFHFSKSSATFVTFLISALVHELTMACLFHKIRGYLFAMQLLQLPFISLSRTKFMRHRTVLGNVMFWLSLFFGPSIIAALYLLI